MTEKCLQCEKDSRRGYCEVHFDALLKRVAADERVRIVTWLRENAVDVVVIAAADAIERGEYLEAKGRP